MRSVICSRQKPRIPSDIRFDSKKLILYRIIYSPSGFIIISIFVLSHVPFCRYLPL